MNDRRFGTAHWICVGLVVAVVLAPTLALPLGPDSSMFFVSAQKIIHQEALHYRDIFVDDDGTELDLGVEVRVEAADALAHFDAPSVVDDLTAALSDPEPAVRLAALEAISKLGMPAAVERLVELAVARDEELVTERAFELLASYGLEGTADLMAERLVDRSSPAPDARHRDELLRLIEMDPRGENARGAVADRAIAHLRDPRDKRTAERVETILGWLGPRVAGRVLAELERDAPRPELVRAAGLLGDARAVDAIIRGLHSDDPDMRWSAATAAGSLNHTRAVPALLGATQDDEQSVRDAASAALDRMGTAAVLAGLATLMQNQGRALAGDGVATLASTVSPEVEAGGGSAAELLQSTGRALADANGAGSGAQRAVPPPPAPPAERRPVPYQPRRRGGLVERLLGRLE
jgi:HEAT repeat protein